MRIFTKNKTAVRCVEVVVLIMLAGILLPGCYDESEIKAFLQIPRKPVSAAEYHVYPPDRLSIRSLHVPEINGLQVRVRPDGKINIPLIGEIKVAGKTPAGIQETIVKEAKHYYEQADATVQVVHYASQVYYVFGQVSRPGPRPWTGRDSFLDAMAKAGPTNLAWHERIILTRSAEPQVGGSYHQCNDYLYFGVRDAPKGKEPMKIMINLMAMVEQGDLSNNVLLKPNDVIFVQPSPLAYIGLTIQRIMFPINPAIQAVGSPERMATSAGRGSNQQ